MNVDDSKLIWEAYIQEKYGLNTMAKIGGTKIGGKVANFAAGTGAGRAVGGAALDAMLSQLPPRDKEWLAANIDDDEALQGAAGAAVNSTQGQEMIDRVGMDTDALHKVISNLITQPNIRELVKQKLPQSPATGPKHIIDMPEDGIELGW